MAPLPLDTLPPDVEVVELAGVAVEAPELLPTMVAIPKPAIRSIKTTVNEMYNILVVLFPKFTPFRLFSEL